MNSSIGFDFKGYHSKIMGIIYRYIMPKIELESQGMMIIPPNKTGLIITNTLNVDLIGFNMYFCDSYEEKDIQKTLSQVRLFLENKGGLNGY